MHLCFVDESGTPAKPGQKNQEFFVIAGLIIPEDRWFLVRRKLLGLKVEKKYFGEVKWRYFAPNNKDASNPMLRWDQERKNEFRSRIFRIISEQRSIKIVSCVCQSSEAYKIPSIISQSDIYFRTYKPVTERFQYFLQDLTRETGSNISGIIVADHRGRGDDDKMRTQHERLVREDRKYTSTYGNFVESLFFSPSHMSIGIQLADMIAGAIWRRFQHDDERYFNQIRNSFRRSPSGKTDGFGIVRFPKSTWTGPEIN